MKGQWQKFMLGRYGIDSLGIFVFFLGTILLGNPYLMIPGAVLAGWALFRFMSKNTSKRFLELQKYNDVMGSVRRFFHPFGMLILRGLFACIRKIRFLKMRWVERKEFILIPCDKCRKSLRIPRNKGKLLVSCPVCGNEFIRKT